MAESPPPGATSSAPVFQKNNNLFLDINPKTETQKAAEKKENGVQNSKNGSNSERPPSQGLLEREDCSQRSPIIDHHLLLLRRQIESLKSIEVSEARQCLESQLFVLRKRRGYSMVYSATSSRDPSSKTNNNSRTGALYWTGSLIAKSNPTKIQSS